MEENKKSTGEMVITITGKAATWFISAAFIMWGWNVIAPHVNAPLFSYWEVFAIRMGLSYLMAIFWQKDKNWD